MPSPRKNHAHGINLAVARALTQARKDADFTNEALAAALPNISLTSLQRYLAGRSAIDVEVLGAICEAIGVDEREIMDVARKLRDESEVDAGADAVITRIDELQGRSARTKDEMQRMDKAAARKDVPKKRSGR